MDTTDILDKILDDLGCKKTIEELYEQEKELLKSLQKNGIITPYVKFLQEKYGEK